MNKILNIIKRTTPLIGLLGLVISCTTNDVDDQIPAGVSSSVFAFTDLDKGLTNKVRGTEISGMVGEPANFKDLSVHVNSRTWKFPEGSVNILESTNNTSSSSQDFFVKFRKPGKIDVVLEVEPITDLEIVTDTIPINVISRVDGSMTNDPEESIFNLDTRTLTVEAGKEFSVWPTLGNPDETKFTVRGPLPSLAVTDSIGTKKHPNPEFFLPQGATFILKKLGKFGLNVNSFNSKFEVRAAQDFIIDVVPNSDPVEIQSVEGTDGNIKVVFTRELESINEDITSLFSVSINNGAIPVQITTVTVDSNDPSILNIGINERLFANDNVELSYNGDKLVSTDFYTIDAIDKLQVSAGENFLASTHGGFEKLIDPDTNEEIVLWDNAWNMKWKTQTSFVDTSNETNKVFEGERSLLFNTTSEGATSEGASDVGVFLLENDVKEGMITPETGTYEVSFKVYAEKTSPDTVLNLFLLDGRPEQWFFSVGSDIDALPIGEWKTLSGNVELEEGNSINPLIRILGLAEGAEGRGESKIFVDDLQLKLLR